LTHINSRGGDIASEHTAVAVSALRSLSCSVAISVTALANRRIAAR
jgi:hypothetical protein